MVCSCCTGTCELLSDELGFQGRCDACVTPLTEDYGSLRCRANRLHCLEILGAGQTGLWPFLSQAWLLCRTVLTVCFAFEPTAQHCIFPSSCFVEQPRFCGAGLSKCAHHVGWPGISVARAALQLPAHVTWWPCGCFPRPKTLSQSPLSIAT